jgi:hypothetical protein
MHRRYGISRQAAGKERAQMVGQDLILGVGKWAGVEGASEQGGLTLKRGFRPSA